MANTIKVKRGTNLSNAGTPAAGELVWNSNTNKLYIGDGSTAATSLIAIGGVTLGGHTMDDIDIGSEFVDADDHLMSAGAIKEKIESYGYATQTGDITGVTAGTNLSGGGTSGTVTLNVDDAFLINSGNDTTSGTITAAGFTTTGDSQFGNRIHMDGASPFLRIQESGETNTPEWWVGADGGNFSIRLNNSGAYPLAINTDGENDAVSSMTLGYATTVSGTLTASSGITLTGDLNVGSGDLFVDDSAGAVGIGTNSPLGVLNVIVPTYSSRDTDAQQVIIANSGDAGKGIRFGYDNSGHKGIINVLDPGVAWGNLCLQDGGGNVGIGTDSPAYKLQVSGGDIAIDVAEKLYFGGGAHTYIGEDIDDRLRFFCGGAEFMRFTEDTTDLVSIYEDTYFSKRALFDGGNFSVQHDSNHAYISNNSGNMYIRQQTDDADLVLMCDDGSGGDAAYLTLDGSATQTLLHQDTVLTATKKLYLDGGGDTYISEPSANQICFTAHGSDRMKILASGAGIQFSENFSATDDILHINPANGHNRTMELAGDAINVTVTGGASNTLKLNEDGGDVDICNGDLYIDESANAVGIGTSSPGYKLDVAGDIGIDGYINHNGDDAKIGFEGNDAIRMYTGSAVSLAIDSSGHVGIREANPTTELHFGTCPDARVITFDQSGRFNGIGTYFSSNAVDSQLWFYCSDGGTDGDTNIKMKVFADGRLKLLSADGSEMLLAKATRWGYSSGYKALIIGETSGNYTTSFGYDPNTNSSPQFTGDGRELIFRNGAEFFTPNSANDGWHNDVLVLKDGKVGMGLSAPSQKLEVTGHIKATNGYQFLGDSTSGVLSTGSWYGDLGSNGFERVCGLSHDGGEFVIVEKNGQVSTLIDGSYFAYEAGSNQGGGFYSSSDSSYANATGIVASGGTLYVKQADGTNASFYVTGDSTVGSGYINSKDASTDLYLRRGTNNDDRITIEASAHRFHVDATERMSLTSSGVTCGQINVARNANPNADTTMAINLSGSYGGGIHFTDTKHSGIWCLGSGTEMHFGVGGSTYAGLSSDQGLFMMHDNGDFHANEDVIAFSSSVGSDKKFKKNIKDSSYGLSDVMKMRAVEYDWIEKRKGKHDIGVIAQEIEEIIPEVVQDVQSIGGSEGTHKVVDYGKLASVLIKAIQEQQVQIDELKTKLGE